MGHSFMHQSARTPSVDLHLTSLRSAWAARVLEGAGMYRLDARPPFERESWLVEFTLIVRR